MNPPIRKKLRHYDLPGHAHFYTFSCFRRLPLLSKERTCRWTIQAIDKARTRFNFSLWAYVIMPEHVHLLIYPRDEQYSSAKILHYIKESVGRRAINLLKQTNSPFLTRLAVNESGKTVYRFWQHSAGFDANHTDPTAIHEVIQYIHLNPLRRGLVLNVEDWFWSSAKAWLLGVEEPLRVDRDVPTLHV